MPRAATQRPGIWQLAWPSIVGNLLFSLTGIIAIKVVGELGASAVAAVTSGNQIFFGMQAILMAIGAGTTALVARAWGAEDYDEAIRVTYVSMIVAAIVALFMTVPGVLFPVQISAVFGLDTATTELAADFIFWMSWFNLAFAVNMIVGSALRAAGDVMTPLWLGVATNLVYLLTVYVFVYGAWGIPALGVKGAAIANGIAFSFAGLLLMWLWWRGKLVLGWRRIVFWEGERVRQLLHIGYPAGLEQLIFRIGFFLFLGIIGHYYGTAAYAAYGIGINVLSLCFVVGFGFSISGSTLVGQYLGARDTAGAIHSGWRSLWLALGSMAAIGAVCIIFAEQIARFMIEDEEVVDLTISFIYIMGSVMPLMAVEFAIGGALRGAGDTRAPLRATLVGLLVMRCGLAIIFTFYEFSVVWIYGAIVGDYLAKAVMLLHRFYHGRWQTVIPNTPQPAA